MLGLIGNGNPGGDVGGVLVDNGAIGGGALILLDENVELEINGVCISGKIKLEGLLGLTCR